MVQTFTLANISDIWSFAAGGLQITATGDVTGVTVVAQSQATTLPCTVVALQGQNITSTAPTSNQALVWNSGTSKWTPTTIVNSFNTRTGAVTLTAADVGAVSSATAPAHQWFNAFSTGGAFSSSQPAFSDINGAIASTQLAVGATLAFSGNTLETAAFTGDVTAAANSFATTVAKIQGTTVSGTTGTGDVVFSASPAFTGSPTAPTQTAGDNSTKVATTAYADGNFVRLTVTAQNFTGGVRTPSFGLATGNVTLDPGNGQLQNITNGGAFTITAPAHDGSIVLDIVNNASASTITWSGFTSEANHGDPLDTTNGHKFRVSITTNNSVSTYIIHALQ